MVGMRLTVASFAMLSATAEHAPLFVTISRDYLRPRPLAPSIRRKGVKAMNEASVKRALISDH